MEEYRFIQDMSVKVVSLEADDPDEDMLLARKKVLYALRNTPETQRCSGYIGSMVSETNCAIGLMARELDVFKRIGLSTITGNYITVGACQAVSAATGWPEELMKEVYRRNDARVVNNEYFDSEKPELSYVTIKPGKFSYSWPQIADFLEGAKVDG